MSILLILILHIMLTLLYWGFNSRYSSVIENLTETILVLLIPFFGIIIMVLFKIISKAFGLDKGENHEAERKNIDIISKVELNDDIIPLNDAFLLDDTQRKRQYFTESIKQAVIDNQRILQMAVKEPDREIAYYAVSMLTTRMEKLESELLAKEKALAKSEKKDDIELLTDYARLLKEYLAQKQFVDHVTWRNKQDIYIKVLTKLCQLRPDEEKYYADLIDQLLDVAEYKEAESVCEAYLQKFPAKEAAFLLFIKLYQAWRKPQKLQAKIRALKASSLQLSWQGLQTIRFWDRG
ncbi:MAG: hypothetical protein SPK53_02160 [Selenomonas sp.]|nr:hypothetical protein [Selenomonadales bacterium]MDY5716551.1 hypothetical protein [Selenomonas sp.]